MLARKNNVLKYYVVGQVQNSDRFNCQVAELSALEHLKNSMVSMMMIHLLHNDFLAGLYCTCRELGQTNMLGSILYLKFCLNNYRSLIVELVALEHVTLYEEK